jgi:hypothetical protein
MVAEQNNQVSSLRDLVSGQGEGVAGLESETAALTRIVTSIDAGILSFENRMSMFHVVTIGTLIAGIFSIVVSVILT